MNIRLIYFILCFIIGYFSTQTNGVEEVINENKSDNNSTLNVNDLNANEMKNTNTTSNETESNLTVTYII